MTDKWVTFIILVLLFVVVGALLYNLLVRLE